MGIAMVEGVGGEKREEFVVNKSAGEVHDSIPILADVT
jgi:hypothetical protein